ncbi:MAG: UDP-3-O-acyl-N-acetylglucosamine deacetylase [Dongiaceae bacterium]
MDYANLAEIAHPQKTLRGVVRCAGVGLHSGQHIHLTLHPAPIDHGIIFYRTDVAAEKSKIPALWPNVIDTTLCTVIGNEHGVTIGTVEHLLAALAGAGIDNARIEIDGAEVPIMDGSSQPFVFLTECAGASEQAAPRRFIKVLREIKITDKDKTAILSPADHLTITCQIDFANLAVQRQSYSFTLRAGAFKTEIARARTFGFMKEVERLRAHGLALGGSMDNAIVIGEDRILNQGGLRFTDEFARHKVLDCLGDIALAGYPILGNITTYKGGHALNNQLLHALFADSQNWELTTLTGEENALDA